MSYQPSYVNVTGNKSLVDGDQGTVQNVTATATLTLPAAAAGKTFIIKNGVAGANAGSKTITVTTAGTDTVTGLSFTAAANKGPVNTNGQFGDEVTLVGGSGTWYVARSSGTWTRQP